MIIVTTLLLMLGRAELICASGLEMIADAAMMPLSER